jgi:hypothetical protein
MRLRRSGNGGGACEGVGPVRAWYTAWPTVALGLAGGGLGLGGMAVVAKELGDRNVQLVQVVGGDSRQACRDDLRLARGSPVEPNLLPDVPG